MNNQSRIPLQTIAACLLVAALSLLASCSDPVGENQAGPKSQRRADPILGKWGNAEYLAEFRADGYLIGGILSSDQTIIWNRIDDQTIRLSYNGLIELPDEFVTAEVDGDTLTLSQLADDDSVESMILKRNHPGPS